jgi:hypothetical protein
MAKNKLHYFLLVSSLLIGLSSCKKSETTDLSKDASFIDSVKTAIDRSYYKKATSGTISITVAGTIYDGTTTTTINQNINPQYYTSNIGEGAIFGEIHQNQYEINIDRMSYDNKVNEFYEFNMTGLEILVDPSSSTSITVIDGRVDVYMRELLSNGKILVVDPVTYYDTVTWSALSFDPKTRLFSAKFEYTEKTSSTYRTDKNIKVTATITNMKLTEVVE